jgi:hypothetical protein
VTQLREPAIRGAQLFTASGFALAQPLFDILGKNATFFAARESTVAEIVVFALVVTFVPAALLLSVELLVGLVSPSAARVLHLVFVAALLAIVALHILTRRDSLDEVVTLLVAALLGACGALLVWRTRFASSLLTVLAPAPLVFLALFLFGSPVLKLISADTALATHVAVRSKTPVVLVVFDEFATSSLMDRTGRIDARRWPTFAALARTSTWYRNATTVHPHTEHAVPAILDGRLPEPDQLPVLSDHPRNLFTFLGGSYDMEVVEGLTHLCPRNVCESSPKSSYAPPEDRMRSLAHDTGVVYLHLVLPERYAAELPPIDRAWGNFGGAEQSEEEATGAGSRSKADTCARNICQLASSVEPTTKPTLYFVHSLLPHTPWLYLPSGRSYGGDVHKIPGLEKGVFGRDSWLATQAEQRYLLQLGYTDRALGILLRKLRASRIYDRALVIVSADHGVGLRPATALRNVARGNLADIAFMPLFVKLPGQRRGRIDDSFARTIDILPTIADVLDTRLPWKVDGRSLAGKPLPKDGSVSLLNSGDRPVAAQLSALRRERAQQLADRIRRFGTGSLARVYRVGPDAQLLGRKVASLRTRPSTGMRVELSQREVLAAVDPSSGFLPTYVSGVVTGTPQQVSLAVAVNGTLRAVTRSYAERGEVKFNALVPETALRAGPNEISVYAVARTASGWSLQELRGTQLDYVLDDQGRLETSDGKVVRVTSAVSGEVRGARRGSDVTFGGWAASLGARRAASTIVVLVDGRSVFVGRNGNVQESLARQRYGIEGAGFRFRLPGALIPSEGDPEVRVFARSGGIASELRYVAGYPWRTKG